MDDDGDGVLTTAEIQSNLTSLGDTTHDINRFLVELNYFFFCGTG